MTTLDKAVLYLSADIDGDGEREDAEFHMRGDLVVKPSIRTGFLVGGRGSTVNSVVSNTTGGEQSGREGYRLDLGGGARIVEIEFTGWEGSDDQWGNTGDGTEVTVGDATGASAVTQMEVLMEYLNVGEYDSRNPATLEYGEHHPDGIYSAIDVVLEGPQTRKTAEDGEWFQGTLTCISVQSLEDAVDATGLRG